MAHRGRRYPVAFRRDWNQKSDISNPAAHALHWRVTVRSGVSPPYGVDGSVFVCGPDVYVSPNELRWQSPVQHVSGFDWRLTVFATYPFIPDTKLTGQWQLERMDRGRVAFWVNHSPSYLDPWSFESGFAKTLQLDGIVFPRGGFFENSVTTPVGH